MDTRPTKTFRTSGGYELVLNQYITGEEHWAIKSVYIRDIKSQEAQGQTNSTVELDAEKKAIGFAVVSVSGPYLKGETVIDQVFSMPLADFNEVTLEVKEAVEGKKKLES
jgi:hypothetical protein